MPPPSQPPAAPSPEDEAFVHEVVRVYRRYAAEIVERFRFCPYAERCRAEGGTREIVCLDVTPDLERSLALVRSAADDRRVEIGLLIFPNATLTRLELSRFVEQLRRAHQNEPGGLVMAMEAFHPDASADLDSADRHVPFVRRTPDPTIQLVRHEVLLQVRRAGDHGTAFFDPSRMSLDALLAAPAPVPLHTQIARANLETTKEHGVAAIEEIYADIRRDRDQSYARVRGEVALTTRGPSPHAGKL
ncbi:MAG: DUF1415 family protein [Sandaracinaceae bacterium]|nr:DUF1415 family protein [Sandaracinaceae bacterium]